MSETWVKPNFEVIDVGMECTAYAGARPPREERTDELIEPAENP